MSPVIFLLEQNIYSHDSLLSGCGGGSIMAMGSPLRVTKRACPVCFTLLKTTMQVALNFDITVVSCSIVTSQ